ncbi:MAG: hypothetical protein N2748_01055, partial [candidate division WOR-3 bacterium]|nr:hypothetical protein [candidate division WOR-3 bacterium]
MIKAFKSIRIKYLISSIFIFIGLAFGEIIIDKNQRRPLANQQMAIKKLVRNATRFRGNPIRDRKWIEGPFKLSRRDTIKLLAIRVEFVEDTTPLTTGNGKMDLAGFLSPDSGLFYDPPHDKQYFEHMLKGMQNYYLLNSLGKLYIDYTVMPNGNTDCYQLPHPMDYYGDTMWKAPHNNYEGVETGLCRLMNDAIRIADRDPALQFSDYDVLIIFHAGAGLQSDDRRDSPFDLLAGTIPSSALEAYLGIP